MYSLCLYVLFLLLLHCLTSWLICFVINCNVVFEAIYLPCYLQCLFNKYRHACNVTAQSYACIYCCRNADAVKTCITGATLWHSLAANGRAQPSRARHARTGRGSPRSRLVPGQASKPGSGSARAEAGAMQAGCTRGIRHGNAGARVQCNICFDNVALARQCSASIAMQYTARQREAMQPSV